jgi:hypothetical protein
MEINAGKSSFSLAILNSRPAWKINNSLLYQRVKSKALLGNGCIYNLA